MGPALYLHRHGVRRGVRLALPDAVAAARGPLFQGLVSGASSAVGYGLGVFAVWLVRFMRSRDSSPSAPGWAWAVLVPVAFAGIVGMNFWFHVWQDRVRDLMGVPHLGWLAYPWAALLSVIVLFALVELGQLTRRLIRFLVRQLNRVAPPRISAVTAVTLLMVLVVALLNGVVVKVAMRTLNHTFAAVNDEMGPTPQHWRARTAQAVRDRWRRGSRWAGRAESSPGVAPPSPSSPRSTGSPRRSRSASTRD